MTSVRMVHALTLGAIGLVLAGCEKSVRDMYDQPKYKTLAGSNQFEDGRSARIPVSGTVPRLHGAIASASGGRTGSVYETDGAAATVRPLLGAIFSGGAGGPPQVNPPQGIPFAATRETYARGRERFKIFCAPCHGELGNGQGLVAQRGFPKPPSYHEPALRNAPDRHLYDVITQGYGAMYSYADRVPPNDRWAIVAYIRALQLSQYAPGALIPKAARSKLRDSGATSHENP